MFRDCSRDGATNTLWILLGLNSRTGNMNLLLNLTGRNLLLNLTGTETHVHLLLNVNTFLSGSTP
jgi:hypothetical protein